MSLAGYQVGPGRRADTAVGAREIHRRDHVTGTGPGLQERGYGPPHIMKPGANRSSGNGPAPVTIRRADPDLVASVRGPVSRRPGVGGFGEGQLPPADPVTARMPTGGRGGLVALVVGPAERVYNYAGTTAAIVVVAAARMAAGGPHRRWPPREHDGSHLAGGDPPGAPGGRGHPPESSRRMDLSRLGSSAPGASPCRWRSWAGRHAPDERGSLSAARCSGQCSMISVSVAVAPAKHHVGAGQFTVGFIRYRSDGDHRHRGMGRPRRVRSRPDRR